MVQDFLIQQYRGLSWGPRIGGKRLIILIELGNRLYLIKSQKPSSVSYPLSKTKKPIVSLYKRVTS